MEAEKRNIMDEIELLHISVPSLVAAAACQRSHRWLEELSLLDNQASLHTGHKAHLPHGSVSNLGFGKCCSFPAKSTSKYSVQKLYLRLFDR